MAQRVCAECGHDLFCKRVIESNIVHGDDQQWEHNEQSVKTVYECCRCGHHGEPVPPKPSWQYYAVGGQIMLNIDGYIRAKDDEDAKRLILSKLEDLASQLYEEHDAVFSTDVDSVEWVPARGKINPHRLI